MTIKKIGHHPKIGVLPRHKDESSLKAWSYTKMPEKTSVDWLIASRKVEKRELSSSTSSRNSSLEEVKRWLGL